MLVLVGLFLIYPTVNAAGLVPCGRNTGTPEEMKPCTTCDLFALASRIINFVLFTVVPAVAVLFYLIGGIMILLGGANPGLVSTGKNFFWNTTIGLFIIFGAWMITNTVLKSLVGDSDYSKKWFTIECVATVQKPPSTTRYACNSENQCVVNASGEYTDSTCAGKCAPVQTFYICDQDTNQCRVDPEGNAAESYTTSNCDNECAPAQRFYTCNDGDQCVEDPEGEYDTSNCDNECQPLPVPVTISTSSLSDAIVNQSYAQPVNASGGVSPLRYLISSGSLPPGLTLSTNGIITGTPTTANTYTFTVKVEDSTTPTKQSATKELSIKVVAAAAGVVISNVTASNITATGVTITWTTDKPSTSQVEYGTSSSFGSSTTIDNTPKTSHSVTVTGLIADTTYSYRAKSSVTGFAAVSSTNTFKTLAAGAPLSITNSSLPDGLVGRVGYGRQIEASGGTTPYVFSISTGSLPPGLTMPAGGIISGTPTVAGTYNFTIKVEDSSSPKKTATKPLSIKINSTLACLFDGINLCQGQSLKLSGGKLVPNAAPACGVSRCSQYVSAINAAASKTGISANLLKATMFKESACSVSAANTTITGGESYGLMQMQVSTANTFRNYCGVTEVITPAWMTNPANADKTICLAAYFYKSLADGACGYSPRNILAGYSAGPGRCQASRDCANEKSCSGETVRQWECLYDNPEHTVCNGDNTVIGSGSKLNETRYSVVNKLYCVDHPGF